MYHATAIWKQQFQFQGCGKNNLPVIVDGEANAGNSPMELVLIALCGCTGYDVVSILQKKREPLTGLEISVEAERAPEPPRIYTHIKLLYRVMGNVTRKSVEDAVRLSEEKYCSVGAMLSKSARITHEIKLDAS